MKVGQANPNGYLTRLAQKGLIRELEKVNLRRSLLLLQQRVDLHFQKGASNRAFVTRHFAFGSYTRGTMLPRSMDPLSDVDYLILFSDSNLRPQSCLDRLRRFVETHYGATNEIVQSHPTIVLSLNHIRFELVPAIETLLGGIQIPVKGVLFNWMPTNPNEFNTDLTNKNRSNEDLIKPMVRVVKYWNALSNYPFESYNLEQMIVSHWKLATVLSSATLWRRFRDFMNDLSIFEAPTELRKNAISRAQKMIAEVRSLESADNYPGAERALKALLPEPR